MGNHLLGQCQLVCLLVASELKTATRSSGNGRVGPMPPVGPTIRYRHYNPYSSISLAPYFIIYLSVLAWFLTFKSSAYYY